MGVGRARCRPRIIFALLLRRPPAPTLFPYTTLFRSLSSATVVAVAFGLWAFGQNNKAALLVADALFVLVVLGDRKSTRLNSSHVRIPYAVFCLKKKTHVAIYAGRRATEAGSAVVVPH